MILPRTNVSKSTCDSNPEHTHLPEVTGAMGSSSRLIFVWMRRVGVLTLEAGAEEHAIDMTAELAVSIPVRMQEQRTNNSRPAVIGSD